MVDLHQRYTRAILNLLPPGRGLTRREGTKTYQLAEGLADELTRIHGRRDDLLEEVIPWTSEEMLPDWEEVLGITPEPGATLADRQNTVLTRIQLHGPPTIPGLHAIADLLGYELTLKHDAPFECGAARIGMRIGGERRIFTWEGCYQIGGPNDALLERLLSEYAEIHTGGRLYLQPADFEATFRGRGADLIESGGSVTGWTNVGDVSPLPSNLAGGPGTLDSLEGEDVADMDSSSALVSTDPWNDYVSVDAAYVIAAIAVDAAASTKNVFAGGADWGVRVVTGPALEAYLDDGASGVVTAQVPITLATATIVEFLHARDWLVMRVYDDAGGHRIASIPAGDSVDNGGVLEVGEFDGRVGYFATWGARGTLPPAATRTELAVEAANLFNIDYRVTSGGSLRLTSGGDIRETS